MTPKLNVHGHTRQFEFQCQRIINWISTENEWRECRGYEHEWHTIDDLARGINHSNRQTQRYAHHLVERGWLKYRKSPESFGFWYFYEFQLKDETDPRNL